jgi:hypothetical protein
MGKTGESRQANTRRMAKPRYKMPDKETFQLDAAIGGLLAGTGEFRTKQQIMAHFRVSEQAVNQRARIVARILDAEERREIEQVLYVLGRETTEKKKQDLRAQNTASIKEYMRRWVKKNYVIRRRAALVNRIITMNANLPAKQFRKKIIPLIRRILRAEARTISRAESRRRSRVKS